MSLIKNFTKTNQLLHLYSYSACRRNYAVASSAVSAIGTLTKIGKKKIDVIKLETKSVPVEKDVNKLIKFVCGTNLLAEGGEDIEIKADSEYPDWLWKLKTGPPAKLNELDPNTLEYWEKARQLEAERIEMLRKKRAIKKW